MPLPAGLTPSEEPQRSAASVAPIVRVVAAVITDARHEWFFAAQRISGRFAGCWEFPGGKVDPGESPGAALQRELREEGVIKPDGIVTTRATLATVEYRPATWGHFDLTHFLVDCGEVNSDPPIENPSHAEFRWLRWQWLRDFPLHRLSPGMAAFLALHPTFPEIP